MVERARNSTLRDRRIQYETAGLDVGDLAPTPIEQWHEWHTEAFTAGIAEPNAMTLSSVDSHGAPDARIVLVRGADESGFTFFTNLESAKSQQLKANPRASAVFCWLDLHRQVRVRGIVGPVSERDSDDYFASRPRESQIGAWSSPQSKMIADRAELELAVAAMSKRFEDVVVPRPPHWGGWHFVPHEFEFWQGRPSRLHDRLRYRLVDGAWLIERLAP